MLSLLEAARRRRENPLWPLSWAVVYRDGTRFPQYDLAGYHYAREIDPGRVVRLDVLGHSDSPIPIYPPWAEAPDEVVLRAQVTRAIQSEWGTRDAVRRLFGYRYGSMGYLLRIDDDGRIEVGVVTPILPAPHSCGHRLPPRPRGGGASPGPLRAGFSSGAGADAMT